MSYPTAANKTAAQNYMSQFSATTKFKVSAIVYMDYEIGTDAWPTIVVVIFGTISMFFIVTLKCFPKLAKKMYAKCPKLIEENDAQNKA